MRNVSGAEAAGATQRLCLCLCLCIWSPPSRCPNSTFATLTFIVHALGSTAFEQWGGARSIVGDGRLGLPDRDASNAADALRQQPQYPRRAAQSFARRSGP